MTDVPIFGSFDKDAETDIESRYLPHWFQPGVAVFITFRTADSLPRNVVLKWDAELRDWLAQAGFQIGSNAPLPSVESLPFNLQKSFQKYRERLWHWQLDSCHGNCLLRRRDLAEIVMRTLQHFNGERYDLASAIVMPNHVHLIVQFNAPVTCRKQCTSWLHYSAHEINRVLNRLGEFWQSEPFDHLVRSETQFSYLQRYIANNGRNARLPDTDYLYQSFV